MPRLHLGLVLHNHQPVGNYGFVFEDLYQRSYLPMLQALERHPGVRVAIHNSGPLIDWLLKHHPDYIDRLGELVRTGQVEPVSGGYYEPILPMIPDVDKVGQIRKMSSFIEDRFGVPPTGLWLAERVWEPGLPPPLAEAGITWTVVDDAHFRMAGMRDEDLDGCYVTEDQGARLRIFAGSQRLRYTIPWSAVDDVMADLRALADAPLREGAYILLADDGEKFGGWPATYEHVWEQGWVDRFFDALEHAADWLEVVTPGAYLRRFDARGLVYLPTASYAEMMEWAMPPDTAVAQHRTVERLASAEDTEALRFVRGGFWRFFLAKYPEANAMHKRGLRIDAKLKRAANGRRRAVLRDAARIALWRAQCNCPYWHGVFGGLYLRHIRAVTNGNLIDAERLADEAAGVTEARIEAADFDYDGRDDLLVQGRDISLLLHPGDGGAVSQLDFRRRNHAMLDVLARRREAYHEALLSGDVLSASDEVANIHGAVKVKQEGLDRALVFDRYRRAGLQEWIVAASATVKSFSRGDAHASFEPDGRWQVDATVSHDAAAVRLVREHGGWHVSKRISVPSAGERVDVRYEITNTTGARRHARFISEWNVSVPHAPEGDDRIALLDAGGTTRDLTSAVGAIEDVTACTLRGTAPWIIACDLDAPAGIGHFPVQTVSSSEGGLELVYQGASIAVTRVLDLAPGESLTFAFAWSARAV